MDYIAVMSLSMAGLIALFLAARRQEAGLLGRLMTWAVAMPWLAIYFLNAVRKTDATSVFTWHGEAEMGHLTLAIICVAFTWLWLGGRDDPLSMDH